MSKIFGSSFHSVSYFQFSPVKINEKYAFLKKLHLFQGEFIKYSKQFQIMITSNDFELSNQENLFSTSRKN